MKHAGRAALDQLAPLLDQIRALPALKEKRPGIFYAKSRAVLHFHEDAAGLFADVRGPGLLTFERIKIDDPAGATAVLTVLTAHSAPPHLVLGQNARQNKGLAGRP